VELRFSAFTTSTQSRKRSELSTPSPDEAFQEPLLEANPSFATWAKLLSGNELETICRGIAFLARIFHRLKRL